MFTHPLRPEPVRDAIEALGQESFLLVQRVKHSRKVIWYYFHSSGALLRHPEHGRPASSCPGATTCFATPVCGNDAAERRVSLTSSRALILPTFMYSGEGLSSPSWDTPSLDMSALHGAQLFIDVRDGRREYLGKNFHPARYTAVDSSSTFSVTSTPIIAVIALPRGDFSQTRALSLTGIRRANGNRSPESLTKFVRHPEGIRGGVRVLAEEEGPLWRLEDRHGRSVELGIIGFSLSSSYSTLMQTPSDAPRLRQSSSPLMGFERCVEGRPPRERNGHDPPCPACDVYFASLTFPYPAMTEDGPSKPRIQSECSHVEGFQLTFSPISSDELTICSHLDGLRHFGTATGLSSAFVAHADVQSTTLTENAQPARYELCERKWWRGVIDPEEVEGSRMDVVLRIPEVYDFGMRRTKSGPVLTQGSPLFPLASTLEDVATDLAASNRAFPPFVAFAQSSARFHYRSSESRLNQG
ncbi:hypothetical protein NMY22_g4702 [Coprinellus aureogranulatus]|nr:hypothetical protein NMY22_g4702 [Coprinellus aureogranulatus]